MGLTSVEYGNLDYAFDFFNRILFDNMLPELMITYQYRGRYAGFYRPRFFADRSGQLQERIPELAMNPKVFCMNSDIQIYQTLVHEMAHHWQHSFGNPSRSGYHNREWAKKMVSIGLVPSNTGQPGGKMTGQQMSDYPEPDGLFEKACKRMIESGYTLKIQAMLTARDIFMLFGTQCTELHSILDLMPELPEGGGPEILPSSDPNQNPQLLQAAKQEQKRLKLKYSCPCGKNAWGKPGLKLICGDCQKPFVEIQNGYTFIYD